MLIPLDLPAMSITATQGLPLTRSDDTQFTEFMAHDDKAEGTEVDLPGAGPESVIRSAIAAPAAVLSLPMSLPGLQPGLEAIAGEEETGLSLSFVTTPSSMLAKPTTVLPAIASAKSDGPVGEAPAAPPPMSPSASETHAMGASVPQGHVAEWARSVRQTEAGITGLNAALLAPQHGTNIENHSELSPVGASDTGQPLELSQKALIPFARLLSAQAAPPLVSTHPIAPKVIAGESASALDSLVLLVGRAEALVTSPAHITFVPTGQGATMPTGAMPAPQPLMAQIQVILQALEPGVGPKVTEIALAPETLGRLRLEIVTEGGVTLLRLSAESSETQDFLRRQAEQLLQDLRTSGLEGASLEFGTWRENLPSQHAERPNLADQAPAIAEVDVTASPSPAHPSLGRALHLRL